MAHGQGNRAIESEDGTALQVTNGEAQVRARSTEELLVLLIEEVRELKALITAALG